MTEPATLIVDGGSERNEKRCNTTTRCLRRRVDAMQNFLAHFLRSQSCTPWRALLGPGPDDHRALSFTHIWYLMILSFIPVCSLLADVGIVREYLANDSGLCNWKDAPKPCESIIVVFITYRLGFAISFFFFCTALLLIRTSDDRFTKTALHTGFWIEKIVLVLLISCVSFAFPGGTFDFIWIYVLYACSFLVCLMQMFLLIDLATFLTKIVGVYSAQRKLLVQRASKWLFHILPFTIGIALMASQLYKICTSPCKRTVDYTLFTASSAVCIVTLIYVICCRRNELLHCVTVLSYVTFLTHVATSYRHEVCGLVHLQLENYAMAPNFHSISSLALVYVVFSYALLRQDQAYHFYYGFWCVSSTECSKDFLTQNEKIFDAGGLEGSIRDQVKGTSPHCKDLNETLLDVQSSVFESDGRPCSSDKLNSKEKAGRNEDLCKTQTLQGGAVQPVAPPIPPPNREYSETMIHFLFFLLSSHLTLTCTSWYRLELKDENEVLVKPLSSVVSLYVTSASVVVSYIWLLIVTVLAPHIRITSTWAVLKEFARLFVNFLCCLLYRTPVIFRSNSSSRFVYTMFFFCSLFISGLLLTPFIRSHFESPTMLCNNYASLCEPGDPAFIGMYHVLATTGLFFLLLALALIRVNSTNDLRDVVHNGCWLSKACFLIVIFLVLLCIPDGFAKVWLCISLLCTFTYTIMELLVLLEAVNCSSFWFVKPAGESIARYCMSYILSTFLFVVSATAFVCFFVYFVVHVDCKVNRFFVSLNLTLCIAVSIVSIHPSVRPGGLLRSATVTLFCVIQVWTALTYNPKELCNPFAASRPHRDLAPISDIITLCIALLYCSIRADSITNFVRDQFPIALFLFQIRTNTFQRGQARLSEDLLRKIDERHPADGQKHIEKWLEDCSQHSFHEPQMQPIDKHERLLFGEAGCSRKSSSTFTNGNAAVDRLVRDNYTDEHVYKVPYSYSFFHAVHFLASSYLFIVMMHWLQPAPGSSFRANIHWAMMSVKMVASIFSLLIYLWTLMVPILVQLMEETPLRT